MADKMQEEYDIAAALVKRILDGDKKAEQEMTERYHRGLVFMLRHRSKNEDLANDIAQDTWQIVLEKVRANKIKEPEKLSAFITQTGKYQLLMSYRKEKNNTGEEELDTVEYSEQATQPQDIIEKHNTALVVRKMLKELGTSRDCEIMTRVYLQEQSKQIICEDLQLNDTHFHRVMYRARKRFRELWEDYIGGEI